MAGRATAEDRGADGPGAVDEPAEFLACAADPGYFLHHYGVIDDAQGHADREAGAPAGQAPFRLWPAQVRLLWLLMTTMRVVILKARQLGFSWTVLGYAVWLCMFHGGKVVLFFSQGEREAEELLQRAVKLYERLPEWLRDRCPLAKKPTTEQIWWANGSRIQSLPSTKKAGQSYTASLVVMDEAARVDHGDKLFGACSATMNDGGQMIILSTSEGVGGFFHVIWKLAVEAVNGFVPFFVPWWERPGRDEAWYRRTKATYNDPVLFSQNYPATPSEAFRSGARVRFAADWVEAQEANLREPIPAAELVKTVPLDLVPALLQGLRVYERPWASTWHPPLARDLEYVIGADVAEGTEDGDASDATVLIKDTWEEVACINTRCEPDEFGRILDALGRAYGNADVLVERNNHGHTVLATLKALRYPAICRGWDKKPGFLTNSQTKPRAIDELAVALRDRLITLRDAAALGELAIYRVNADGSTSAPPGEQYHDDRVMARALAIQATKLTAKIKGKII